MHVMLCAKDHPLLFVYLLPPGSGPPGSLSTRNKCGPSGMNRYASPILAKIMVNNKHLETKINVSKYIHCKYGKAEMASSFDYVVVGAGINGTWTALHLSKRGYRTLLLDQFSLPHSRGSSGGQTRIIRRQYDKKFLRDLMADAYALWRTLEQEAGVTLIEQIGMLNFSKKDSRYLQEVLQGYLEDLTADHKVFAEDQLESSYPLIKSNRQFIGVLDKEGGYIWADRALEATRKVAMAHGCTVIDNCQVTAISADADTVKVFAAKFKDGIEAKGVVLCCGPWANRLLAPIGFTLPLRPLKVPVYYWKAKEFIPHTFVSKGNQICLYGFPSVDYPGLVKICYHGGVEVDPDQRDKGDVSLIKKKLQNFIAEHFPSVQPVPSIEESCIYTVTPDNNHILDRHPQNSRIVVGAGFSGTGFKLAPVTGAMLSDLVLQVDSKYDLKPFRADRFGLQRDSKL